MKTLIDLFETPNTWIIELNNKAIYNEPLLCNDGFYYYVYCWVNMDTQWCYVGKHKSDNPDNTENYIGSCRNPHYERSRELHPFDFIILGFYASENECLEAEANIVDKSIIEKYKNKGLFNLKPGGRGIWSEEALKASMGPEVIRKRVQADKDKHGGVMAFHTPEAVKKKLERSNTPEAIKARLETNRRNHGGIEAFNTPEAQNRSKQTRMEKYNGDSQGQLHTPEARKKAVNTEYERYGGLKCHSPEVYEEMKNKNGGVLPFNTPEAYEHLINSRILNVIINTLNKLHELNLDITLKNYDKYRGRARIDTIK